LHRPLRFFFANAYVLIFSRNAQFYLVVIWATIIKFQSEVRISF